MKKIFNIAAPTQITTRRAPLSVEFGISQVDGQPLTQSQDTTLNIWAPDRSGNSPLILAPYLKVVNDDNGEPLEPIAYYKWYVNRIDTWDSSTEQGLVPTSTSTTDNYYLERYVEDSTTKYTGRLIVHKNVDYRTPVTIICVVTFSDTSGIPYSEEARVLLTSENKPEEYYDVNIQTQSPISYDPFWDETTRFSLPCKVSFGDTTLSGSQLSNIRYYWYLDNVLASSSHPAYVSGQGTDTITVDIDYADMLSVKIKIAKVENNVETLLPAMDERIVYWAFPKIEALPYCTAGSAVKSDTGVKQFNAIVQVDGKDAEEALWKKYLLLNWKSKRTDEYTETDRGWGDCCYIPETDLYYGVACNVEVKADIYALSYQQPVVCSNNEVVTVTINGVTETVYART